VTDAPGNLFVADTTNHRIRKVTSTGVVTTFAGSTRGSKEGIGAAAQFSFPEQIAIDKSGNLYVSETIGYANESPTYRIRKITSSGATSTLRTGSGVIQSMAVYGTTTLRLAFSLKESYDAKVWSMPTSGGTASLLVRDGGEIYSSKLASNAAGHLLVVAGGTVSRFTTSWTNLEMPSSGEFSALASNSTGNELFYRIYSGDSSSEQLIKSSINEYTSTQILDLKEPYSDDDSVLYRSREGRALESLSSSYGGSIASVAVSRSGIVYFTERSWSYSDSHGGSIWRVKSFWNAISKGLIKDLSDIQSYGPIPGTGWDDNNWGPNEDYWGPSELSQNSAIRQLIPVDYLTSYETSAHLQPGEIPEPLSVYDVNAAGSVKLQWYRSGVKIPGATSSPYYPLVAGKAVPGVYNLEITYGSGSDAASVVTHPCFITVADTVTAQARSTIWDAGEQQWQSSLEQVVNQTKPTSGTNRDAAFLSGLATAALALKDLESSGLLEKLGFSGNPNPFAWNVTHSGEVPDGILSSEMRAFLTNNIFPRLLEADAQLGKITDKNFLTPFPSINSYVVEGVYADFGDVQLMRAFLKAGMWIIKWMEGMNTDFALDDLRNAFSEGKLSIEWVLAKYPLLLGSGTEASVTASVTHLKAALDAYFAWSDFSKGPSATSQGRMQFINSETAEISFLFALEPTDFADEARARTELKATRASLDSKANQIIPLVFKPSDEPPLFGLLGAKAGAPYNLKVNPLALVSKPTGWRSEVSELGFTKNLAKRGMLPNTTSASNKTMKAIFPDLSVSDFTRIETGLIDSELYLNEKWNTRWDTEPPTVTMDPIGTGGKVTPAEDGTVAVSGTIRDGSPIQSVFVKRTSEEGREEIVNGVLTESPQSVERNRIYTWQAWVPLSSGSNVIAASGVDIWNQTTDKPAIQTVKAEVQFAFSIDQEGEGSVTSSVIGSTVTGGSTIQIQVNPAKNWIFRHFEIYMNGEELDRVTATSLSLKVTGETRIVPVFEPDPFRFMTGPVTLSRRVFDTIDDSDSDFNIPLSILTVTVNKTGSISGKLRVGRQLYPFTTRFDADNTAAVSFRPQLPLKSRDSDRMSQRMGSLSVRLALRTETERTSVMFYHDTEVSASESLDADGGNNELRILGELRPVLLTSNMVFNGSVTDSSSEDDFIHLRLSNLGIASCTGVLGNGERYSASAPVFYGETNDSMGDADPMNGPSPNIRVTLQPITTNKYTVMAAESVFYPPSTNGGPDESFLWSARTSFEGQRWASNNRWTVDASGKPYTPDSPYGGDGDWEYLYSDHDSWIPQFLPATEYSFGAFSPESSFASVRARPFTSGNGGEESYQVGYLKWISSSVLPDLAMMTERNQDYPEMITSDTSRMTFAVNRSTGLFSAKAGWRPYNDQTNTRDLVTPKTFTGVLVSPSMDGPSYRWGIGKSSDGSSLYISGDY
jgi:hypothetical protein